MLIFDIVSLILHRIGEYGRHKFNIVTHHRNNVVKCYHFNINVKTTKVNVEFQPKYLQQKWHRDSTLNQFRSDVVF